jgi:hypothetical protein
VHTEPAIRNFTGLRLLHTGNTKSIYPRKKTIQMILKPTSCFLASVLFLLFSACAQKPGQQDTADTSLVIKTEENATPASDESKPDTIKGSIPSEAAGKIGSAHIRILYTSPAVRGRVIWGKLVPFNKVWVSGAHQATSIETDREITIGGTNIPAGKYALFTIPAPGEWTVIINKNWQQHQADKYSQSEDLLRVTVKPQTVQKNQERLRYEIVPKGDNTGSLVMSWEKMRIEVPVEVN